MSTRKNWRTTVPTGKVRHGAGDADVIRLVEGEETHLNVVDFKDGARTDWHVQPHGTQYLYWITGGGAVGTPDGVILCEEGDLVEIPAGERHWHGARRGQNATHLSVMHGPEVLEWEAQTPEPAG